VRLRSVSFFSSSEERFWPARDFALRNVFFMSDVVALEIGLRDSPK
jgi:hypothetical protein